MNAEDDSLPNEIILSVNTWIYLLDRNYTISQAGTPRHDNCVCLPVSWVTIPLTT